MLLQKMGDVKKDLKHVMVISGKWIVILINNKIVYGITINMNTDNVIMLRFIIIIQIVKNMEIVLEN